jgi:hypothetical protein
VGVRVASGAAARSMVQTTIGVQRVRSAELRRIDPVGNVTAGNIACTLRLSKGREASMAKRRRTAARTTTKIIRVGSPSPIVRIAAPRAPKRRRHHYRKHAGRIGGGIISNESVQLAIGGALYGYAVKSGIIAKLPELPLLGRTGTAAIILDYFGRHGGGQLCTRAAHAAASIAGYTLGMEGKISGDANDYVQGDFAAGDGYEPE